jgi:hypothetical protein
MSATNYSKGPWKILDQGTEQMIVSDGFHVATVPFGSRADEAMDRANACLIAAAPDLYDAVAELLREFVDPEQSLEQFDSCVVRKTVERARSALAKARGES